MTRIDLIDSIKAYAKPKQHPDKTPYLSISLGDIKFVAERSGTTCRDVEILALDNGLIPERYVRNFKTFTPKDQRTLLQSSVTLVGCGGLGGTVAEILARTGVGEMILIDGDVFEESNLNRQLFCTPDVLGKSKVTSARDRIAKINPTTQIGCRQAFVTHDNHHALIGPTDIVVDCLDNMQTRMLLAKSTKEKNLPLVHGAVGGHTGQVMTIFPEDEGLNKIYGMAGTFPEKGIEAELGTVPAVVFMVAAAQCAEVIKVLLEKQNILRNKLLVMDPFDGVFRILPI